MGCLPWRAFKIGCWILLLYLLSRWVRFTLWPADFSLIPEWGYHIPVMGTFLRFAGDIAGWLDAQYSVQVRYWGVSRVIAQHQTRYHRAATPSTSRKQPSQLALRWALPQPPQRES